MYKDNFLLIITYQFIIWLINFYFFAPRNSNVVAFLKSTIMRSREYNKANISLFSTDRIANIGKKLHERCLNGFYKYASKRLLSHTKTLDDEPSIFTVDFEVVFSL